MPSLISPAHDSKIYQKYNKKSWGGKEKNKIAFCKDFELDYKKSIPLLCFSFPLSEENNLKLIKKVIEGMLEQSILIALIGVGTKEYQNLFNELCEKHPGRIAILNETDENKRKIYAASDVFLNTSLNQACIKEMKSAMAYGVVPISNQHEGLRNYDSLNEQGNAFTYVGKSHWSFFSNFIRAIENFKFPYDWKNIARQAMEAYDEDGSK